MARRSMYDIRQFKPALYVIVALGVTGFCMAVANPGLWLIAMALIGFNAWSVRSGRFNPLPRWLANSLTVLLFAYAVARLLAAATPIVAIGEFLIILQVVKLYEQRSNRDYAQLLVLSLLLIVAASISTASLWFGMLLLVYLILALYACLLFHLKVETDAARQMLSLPADEDAVPATLRQDQRFLSGSMRRLTGLIAVFATTLAVIVFLFFPRGAGAGLLGPLQFSSTQSLPGFNDEVSFQSVARIGQNRQIIARIELFDHTTGSRIREPRELYLRGGTHNYYDAAPDSPGRWRWSNIDPQREFDERLMPPMTDELVRQSVTLEPTGTRRLFALAGVTQFSGGGIPLLTPGSDWTLQVSEPITDTVRYTVVSTQALPVDSRDMPHRLQQAMGLRNGSQDTVGIDRQIYDFARRPEVSGRAPDGTPLAELRDPMPRVTQFDAQIARNIETYLQNEFEYTLDLTDALQIGREDPLVQFVTQLKRGHCEYFAGAMTLMLQSLGIESRIVVGFRSGDEYNDAGGYYIVRQSHAHAWVEALTETGWQRFDPTSGNLAEANADAGGFTQRLRHLIDFLEYTWATNIVAYDEGSRESLFQAAELAITNVAISNVDRSQFTSVSAWLQRFNLMALSTQIISGLILLMMLVLLFAVGAFALEKGRLRRRARRIGLSALPDQEQLRLARELGFYDELLRLLDRHGVSPPDHLTPMEFSRSVTFLPPQAYDQVRRLTEIFYRVRFGGRRLR